MTEAEHLFDVGQAAALLHVSKSYVYLLADRRQIEHLRIGKRILFRLEDLTAFIDGCAVPAEPAAGLRLAARR